ASASFFITFSRLTEARILLRRPVLDDEWLTETLRQPLTDQAGKHVDHAARGKAGDQAHRPCRIGLRPRDARDGRQRGSASRQMQKLPPVGNFHGVYVCSPPGRRTVKTEPLPGSLATVTSPPIMRASLRVMASPSPVRPKCCAVRNSRRLISNMARFPPPASAGVPSPRLLAGYRRDFKPELYPQKHGQEDQDRVQPDPPDVGSPTPPLLYGLLAHGEFSLASQCNGSPALAQVSLPPNWMDRSLGQT